MNPVVPDPGSSPSEPAPLVGWDVLGLGAVAVDDLLYVETFPAPDAKVDVIGAARHCGGLTATALVAAARLGVRCGYAGVFGDDEFSRFAGERLGGEGVDLAPSMRDRAARVFHSYIVVGQSAATRNIFADGRGVVGAGDDWPPAEAIRAARVLFVDHVGVRGMLRAARLARAGGIPVVSDLERDSGPGFTELCSLADHFIVSHEFSASLTGESDPARAVARLANGDRSVVAVTAGARGCWYWSADAGKQVRHQPAYTVSVVDTTGCGDVFHGAYAAALSRGLPVMDRIRLATAAAGLKATQPGGQAGAPTVAALDSFLIEREGRDSGMM